MLWRAARMAGTDVATSATPRASATAKSTVEKVSDGALGAPRRPAPGPSTSGAASHPASRPMAAAHRPTSAYSNSRTTATNRGVPPIALSRPTRRVCSATRPPTSTTTLASASSTSSQLPVTRTSCALAVTNVSLLRMLCQEFSVRVMGEVVPAPLGAAPAVLLSGGDEA